MHVQKQNLNTSIRLNIIKINVVIVGFQLDFTTTCPEKLRENKILIANNLRLFISKYLEFCNYIRI
jgi:hypothetical protein